MTLNGYFTNLLSETVWIDASRYQDAERQYQEMLTHQRLNNLPASRRNPCRTAENRQVNENTGTGHIATPTSSLASEIAFARQKIQNLMKSDYESDTDKNLLSRMQAVEAENKKMRARFAELNDKLDTVWKTVMSIPINCEPNQIQSEPVKQAKSNVNGSADDSDIDLFGSDEETEEDLRLKQERVKAYESKKAKKPAFVAKSSVVLDVKPWSDDTDMKELEVAVRKIKMEGLTWGASKLVPLAYGIHKLQIIAIVEDEKVSVDGLQESIQDIEDLVQSVDIAAFNKL
ncbi:elongation factor 1-beta [Caerostris extrusa]|uniref:Elongation factor 1-beta n=1 Tax=Caerostris extrusa TaxID=172846 RepID=A0AAV4TL50_CAEEX|nr:elongation factor 1-beta [Caerostris extrusa]